MSRIRSKETGPERAFRKALCEAGLRGYRKNWRGLFGTPDVAFVAKRVAIFVDSCFWHNCPRHGKIPKTNVEWWERKFWRNRARDAAVTRILGRRGWKVLRLWTHMSTEEMVEKARSALNGEKP